MPQGIGLGGGGFLPLAIEFAAKLRNHYARVIRLCFSEGSILLALEFSNRSAAESEKYANTPHLQPHTLSCTLWFSKNSEDSPPLTHRNCEPRDSADSFVDGVASSDLHVQPSGRPHFVPAVTSRWPTIRPELADSPRAQTSQNPICLGSVASMTLFLRRNYPPLLIGLNFPLRNG
jgi:hypothetical protein